jgi:hypothetical protein
MDSVHIVYDNQAHLFEERAGLPEDAARQVAGAVHGLAGIGPDGLVVEIGAGTGVIGQWLAPLPGRYLGIDSSQPMLDVFRPRLPADGTAALRHADANQKWPVESGTASVIFGSRVLHLLDPDHAAGEALRVAHPDGALMLSGRVAHDRGSPRSRGRARLRELLAERGLRPSQTGGRPERLLALAQERGAEPLPVQVAATWRETLTVSQVIDWWRGKTSLGGVNPPPDVAEEVLASLDAWAAETYGEPAPAVTTYTRYLLEGVRIPPAAAGAGPDAPRIHPLRSDP